MNPYTKEINDYGICNLCGQPIELFEAPVFIRRKGGYETIIVHAECFEEQED